MARREEKLSVRVRRELAEAERRAYRELIDRLEGEARSASKEGRTKLRRARSACKTRRVRVKERSRAEFVHTVETAREKRDRARAAARAKCAADRARILRERDERRKAAKATRLEKRLERERLARFERSAKARQKSRTTSKERASESDGDVRANIAAHLVPLFERVRRSIKAKPHASRTEVFLEYVEEHPAEVFEAIEAESERKLAATFGPTVKSAKPRGRRKSAVGLDDIPF